MTWEDDFSEEFVNVAQVPSEIVNHMRNAIRVSFLKYGSILDKAPSMLKKFHDAELKKLAETGNHERIVNAINYDMFLYMVDAPKPEYLEEARQLSKIYDEAKYHGTDSNQSVTRIRKSVNEWLRARIYESAGIN